MLKIFLEDMYTKNFVNRLHKIAHISAINYHKTRYFMVINSGITEFCWQLAAFFVGKFCEIGIRINGINGISIT